MKEADFLKSVGQPRGYFVHLHAFTGGGKVELHAQ